jgi:hypothetical protein
LLVGDKNAIMIAARVLGYGKDYTFMYNNKEVTVDLSKLEDKKVDESLFKRGVNEFSFTTPKIENTLTFKLLTHGDEKKIEAEVNGMKKVNPDASTDITTRLKYMITSVNGDRDQKTIREFVDNHLLAPDARALREHYGKVTPDINLTFKPEDDNYIGEGIVIPINLNFFWPDSGV